MLLPDVHMERLFVEGSTKGPDRCSSLTAVLCLALKPSSDTKGKTTRTEVHMSTCLWLLQQVSSSIFPFHLCFSLRTQNSSPYISNISFSKLNTKPFLFMALLKQQLVGAKDETRGILNIWFKTF